jgi:2',3'-cyclic-nucleotide 2'-phosphodiesterase (5'-nucleotidase family)
MSCPQSEAALCIVNITDVYKLNLFPHVKTLINQKREQMKEQNSTSKTISILTGDFLAPYLLSAVDKGRGMMTMVNSVPIDYVIFGNHEDDMDPEDLGRCVKDYKGTWINTNVQSYKYFGYQKPFEIIEVSSPDGSNVRKIGLIGVLSDSPSLYKPGAFGGAKIEDPYETIAIYKKILEEEYHVDLVIPLCHLYVPQDEVTCRRFDFPVILSGHDHHVVNEVIDGTLLLKAGADAENAVVLEITWGPGKCSPKLNYKIQKTTEYQADSEIQTRVVEAYAMLEHLKHTQLCEIRKPLSSIGSRETPSSLATFLWSHFREAVNQKCTPLIDVVILNGGEIRGGKNYPEHTYFSMADLLSEISHKLEAVICPIPGEVLNEAIRETHGGPNPGYIQCDDSLAFDESGNIIFVGGKTFSPTEVYRVALTTWDVVDGPSKSLVNHFKTLNLDPIEMQLFGVGFYLLYHFAAEVWEGIKAFYDTNNDGVLDEQELRAIDLDGDGKISKAELLQAIKKIGFEVDTEDLTFAEAIIRAEGGQDFLSVEALSRSGSCKRKKRSQIVM